MPVTPGDDVPAEESLYDKPRVSPFDPKDIEHEVSSEPLPKVPDPTPVEDPEPEKKPEPEDEPLPEFDPRVADEFKGLLYLGALTSEFEWTGHTFKIRTLHVREFIEIGLAIKKYEGSRAYDRAWQAAIVAACLISVDGKPMPLPITLDEADTPFTNAFDYVLSKWFAPTIEAVYAEYIALEFTVGRVVESMGKATG